MKSHLNAGPSPWFHYLIILSLPWMTSILGCTKSSSEGGSSAGQVTSTLHVDSETISSFTDETGLAFFDFSIDQRVTAARFEVSSPAGVMKLVAIQGPNGEIPLSSFKDPMLSPVQDESSPNVLALPLGTAALETGDYSVAYQLSGIEGENANAFVDVSGVLLTKKDFDLTIGAARVNIILAGPVSGSSELRSDLEDAVEMARTILARGNISLDVKFYELPAQSLLPDPRKGDALYQAMVDQVRPFSINIVIGSDVTGLQGPDDNYSIEATGLQPASSSPRSISVISLLKVAGNDGTFNYEGTGSDQVLDDEVRLASEEIAQLIGHALGLPHNIEIQGSQVKSEDSIDDTASCLSVTDCQQDKAVRENFMLPSPLIIPDSSSGYYPRASVTAGQAAVMQRSIFVD